DRTRPGPSVTGAPLCGVLHTVSGSPSMTNWMLGSSGATAPDGSRAVIASTPTASEGGAVVLVVVSGGWVVVVARVGSTGSLEPPVRTEPTTISPTATSRRATAE